MSDRKTGSSLSDVESMSGSSARMKVLYISGWGRSGTTLLDNILGTIPGVFSAGELRHIWNDSMLQNRQCGCERLFADCPIWGTILNQAFGEKWRRQAIQLSELATSAGRTRHAVGSLFGLKIHNSNVSKEYQDALTSLYKSIIDTTDSTTIVDSSKTPGHLMALGLNPSMHVSVVHVVRDPRGPAFAWTKHVKRDRLGKQELDQYTPLQSALYWTTWNVIIEMVAKQLHLPYRRVRYEDLIAAPKTTIRSILKYAALDDSALECVFLDDHTVNLAENHTVAGNPSRFRRGSILLKPDDQWRRGLAAGWQALVLSICWPVMLRYGYL